MKTYTFEIDCVAYASTSWNGEYYDNCYRCISIDCDYPVDEEAKHESLRFKPITEENEDGDFDVVGYEEI